MGSPDGVRMAWWRSGDAADCKSVHAGSIPAQASILNELILLTFSTKWRENKLAFRADLGASEFLVVFLMDTGFPIVLRKTPSDARVTRRSAFDHGCGDQCARVVRRHRPRFEKGN